jgi:hypothetical protein
MTFDQRLVFILKWLAVIIVLVGVIMPVQIVWFLIYPLVKLFKTKAENYISEVTMWLPFEAYSKLSRRILGLE